jgi:hypothetical protein
VTRSSNDLPRTQKVESDDSNPRRGTLVEVNADRLLWRRPPSIADVSSGAWSCFREKTEMTDAGEDKTFMMKPGKANSEK